MSSPSEAASSTVHPSPTPSTSSQHLATADVPLATPLPNFPHHQLRPRLSRDGTEDPIVRQAEIVREAWSPDSRPLSPREKKGGETGYFAGADFVSGEKGGTPGTPAMTSAMKKQGRTRANTVNIRADELLKGPGVASNLRRMTSQPAVGACPLSFSSSSSSSSSQFEDRC